MAPKKRAMRDALCALDGEDSDSSEEEEQTKPSEEETAQAQKKIRLEALERAGYSSGPSLLHIPKQPDDDADAPSGWGTGKGQSVLDHSPTAEVHTDHMRFLAGAVSCGNRAVSEAPAASACWRGVACCACITSFLPAYLRLTQLSQLQERAEKREITAAGIAEEAAFAKRAVEQADKLRQEKQQEKAEKQRKKQLSFKEKEKKKRDTGKQSSGTVPVPRSAASCGLSFSHVVHARNT